MKQNDYIRGQVGEFVTWMSSRLDDDTFKHAYTSRRTRTHWACENLFDAYERYHWTYGDLSGYGIPAGSSFDSSMHALETLQKELNAGLAVGNNERVHRAAIGVMIWGGVTNGNRKWLNDHKNELCHIISRTRDAINAGDTENPLFADGDLRFTSGMSKVYSLVCDDFVIYDSRVAAALGRAVVQFCQAKGQAKGLTKVPEGLDLAWAPAKSAPNAINPPERCAGQARLTFPRLTSGRVYAKWNMLASWLLTAIADHEYTRSSAFATRIESRTRRLRALEAALFMVGYDLGGDSDAAGSATRRHEPVGPQTRRPGGGEVYEWIECETRKRGRQFEYRLGHDAIDTRKPGGGSAIRFPHSEIDETLRRLAAHFGTGPFPLSNSATGVRKKTVPFGLGTAYFEATRKNPPNASRLAAVLEDIGVFEPAPLADEHWTLRNSPPYRYESGDSDV
ncbi:hypothetical protein [Burkholderia cepacia]|uniref:hypothetical protein n=1 Tax=Burkholderia cepacia TaxID=292 RepID=UPI001CF25FBB|nr:hypothetical protein [Burkholderia cepacia]MCA8321710.1 hypothetical protein [Burkholderia cepacia]